MTEAQRQIVGEYYYVLCLKLSAHTCHSCKLPGRGLGGGVVARRMGALPQGQGQGGCGGHDTESLHRCHSELLWDVVVTLSK